MNKNDFNKTKSAFELSIKIRERAHNVTCLELCANMSWRGVNKPIIKFIEGKFGTSFGAVVAVNGVDGVPLAVGGARAGGYGYNKRDSAIENAFESALGRAGIDLEGCAVPYNFDGWFRECDGDGWRLGEEADEVKFVRVLANKIFADCRAEMDRQINHICVRPAYPTFLLPGAYMDVLDARRKEAA